MARNEASRATNSEVILPEDSTSLWPATAMATTGTEYLVGTTVLMSTSSHNAIILTVADHQPTGVSNLQIDVTDGSTRPWYASPVWIAVGVLGFIAILALVMAANRASTTTVED